MSIRFIPGPGMRVVLAAAAAFACVAGLLSADDWPHWRGPDGNGISKETGWSTAWPADGPKVLWKASVGIGFSSFSVAGGKAYTMGNRDNTDTVYCFDAETGREIWKHSYRCPLGAKYYEGGTHFTPTVDGERVYTLSKFGHAFCLNAADGKVVWSREFAPKPPTWGFAGSPLILDETVIFNVGERGVALNKADGSEVWQTGKGPAGYSTPVPFQAGDKQALALFAEKSLVSVDPADGRELWRFPWQTTYEVNAADPIVSGDRMFISSGYNRGCALVKFTASSAEKVWENRAMRNHFNSCVLWEGFLYGFDETTLKCIDFATGAEKWSQNGLGKASLMLADGKLIILAERGRLVIAPVSPEGFKELASAQIFQGKVKCWTTPVLANGRIYTRTAAGDVACLDVKGQ